METTKYSDDLMKKVMEGLTIAVKKVYEDAHKNGQPLAVSIKGKVQLIYP